MQRSTRRLQINDTVELLSKLVIGVVGGLYLVGIVVVNTYLNTYGIFTPSLFRLSYIGAGIWALVPILLWFVVLVSIVTILFCVSNKVRDFVSYILRLKSTSSPKRSMEEHVIAGVLVTLLVLSMAMTLQLGGLVTSVKALLTWPVLVSSLDIAALALISVPLVNLDDDRMSRSIRAVLISVASAIFLLAHSYVFALTSYGQIPSYLGGGEPKEVQLVIESDLEKRRFFEDLGIRFLSKESNVTLNVSLLLVTENEYLILVETKAFLDNRKVTSGITIPKAKVSAVLYEGAIFRGAGAGAQW